MENQRGRSRKRKISPAKKAMNIFKRTVVAVLCFAMVTGYVPSSLAFAAEGEPVIESEGYYDDEVTLDDLIQGTDESGTASGAETGTGTNNEENAESDPDEEGKSEEGSGEVTGTDEGEETPDPDEAADSQDGENEEDTESDDEEDEESEDAESEEEADDDADAEDEEDAEAEDGEAEEADDEEVTEEEEVEEASAAVALLAAGPVTLVYTESGDNALDIYKYTEGTGLAYKIDADDPDANLNDEAFCFTATESGTYYIAYETSGGSSYHFLRSSDFSADAEVENLYYVDSIEMATSLNDIAEITVTAGETYFIHRSSASSAVEYTGPQLCLIAEGNVTSVNTVPTEHAIDMEVGYYEIDNGGSLEGAEFILSIVDAEDNGQITSYAVFEETTGDDGETIYELTGWTESKSEATVIVSGEDGYIHITGLAAGTYTLTETEAPAGYEISDSASIEVEVSEDETNSVSVKNDPAETNEEPDTGDQPNPDDDTVTVSGEKTWDDADDQDGIRPESVKINLVADGIQIDSIEVGEEENWSWSFGDLPKYEDDEEIVYSITEDDVDGYESVVSGYDVTNNHTPETVSVSGSKTWDDADNQDGIRPTSITIRLLADGNETDSKTVTENDSWSWEFTDLNKYNSGTEIVYTITEDEVSGYTTSIDGYNITNSYTPQTTNVTVELVWNDDGNRDGMESDYVIVALYRSVGGGEAEPVKDESGIEITVMLTADYEWTYTWDDLPQYENGEPITYSVVESDVPEGYEAIYTFDEDKDEWVISNNHESLLVSEIVITKVWDDSDDQDGIRPSSIKVELQNGGNTSTDKDGNSWTAELTEEGDWKIDVTDHPVYYHDTDSAHSVISYSVHEDDVAEGYETEDGIVEFTEVESDNDAVKYIGTVTLTNTHTPETVDITGTITWDDDNDADSTRPESVTVRLLANGTEIDSLVVTADDGWSYEFKDLPKYANGVEITYAVEQDPIDGYTTTVGDDGTITNKIVEEEGDPEAQTTEPGPEEVEPDNDTGDDGSGSGSSNGSGSGSGSSSGSSGSSSGSSSSSSNVRNVNTGKTGHWVLEGALFTLPDGSHPSNQYLNIDGEIWAFYTNGYAVNKGRTEYYTEEAIAAAGNIPTATGTWDVTGWWFSYDDGTYPHNEWVQLEYNGQTYWYHFDVDGWMDDGWFTDKNGDIYYLDPVYDGWRGHMMTGWQEIGGSWYYFSEDPNSLGVMLKDTTTPDGFKVDPNGRWTE